MKLIVASLVVTLLLMLCAAGIVAATILTNGAFALALLAAVAFCCLWAAAYAIMDAHGVGR